MKINHRSIQLTSLMFASLAVLVGCGKSEIEEATTSAPDSDPVISVIVLTDPPPAPMPVGQARETAKPGQEIVLIGQVGGTPSPIAEVYATFVIADEEVQFCDEIPDDPCPTPWDACCEDPEKLSANRASVVFVDEEGQPLVLDLRQAIPLSELDLVSVTGTVAPSSTPENLIIHANGIFRHASQ